MRWLRGLGWACLLTAAVGAQAAAVPAQLPLLKLGFYLPAVREANQVDLKVSLQLLIKASECKGSRSTASKFRLRFQFCSATTKTLYRPGLS